MRSLVFHRRAKHVSRGHSAITEPAFMGRQREEEPMHDTDPRREPGKKRGGGSGERGRGASRRAALNGVARDSPGLVNQGVGVLTSAIAARVESKQVNGGGSAKQRQPGHSAVTVGILLCPELN